MKIRVCEFFQDYDNAFSQKRLQIFLAFTIACIITFMGYGIEYVSAFLTYGSVNMLATGWETKIMKEKHNNDNASGIVES